MSLNPSLKVTKTQKMSRMTKKCKNLQKKQFISQNKSTKIAKYWKKLFIPILKMSLFWANLDKTTQFQAGRTPFINI